MNTSKETDKETQGVEAVREEFEEMLRRLSKRGEMPRGLVLVTHHRLRTDVKVATPEREPEAVTSILEAMRDAVRDTIDDLLEGEEPCDN